MAWRFRKDGLPDQRHKGLTSDLGCGGQLLLFVLIIAGLLFFLNSKFPQKPKPKPFKQGFLVKKNLGVSSAKQLDGAIVCLIEGSKEVKLVSDYFKKNSMKYESFTVEKHEMLPVYNAGRCDVMVIFSNANVSSSDKVLQFE